MDTLRLVFTICAAAGGGLFVVRLILQFTGIFDDGGFDGDVGGHIDIGHMDAGHVDVGHAEGGGLADSDISFRLITFQGLTAFFMMFGLTGRAILGETTWGPFAAVAGAAAVGAFTMWVIAKLFAMMRSLQSSGTLDIRNAIGESGSIYLTIPEAGTGKVRVTVQEHLRVFDALADDSSEIKTGEMVTVVRVTDGNVLVVKRA